MKNTDDHQNNRKFISKPSRLELILLTNYIHENYYFQFGASLLISIKITQHKNLHNYCTIANRLIK